MMPQQGQRSGLVVQQRPLFDAGRHHRQRWLQKQRQRSEHVICSTRMVVVVVVLLLLLLLLLCYPTLQQLQHAAPQSCSHTQSTV
jgi:cytochrome c-type biogenesis protein CcmH/NrfG